MATDSIVHPPRTLMEVFQQLPEGTLAQLIENNIVMSPSPSYVHQRVLNELNFALQSLAKKLNLGQILVAPMDVYLDDENAYQPDILFISNENKHIIEEDGIHGAPDLIIEILSPATAQYDLHEKKAVYERSGVREYWTVDPESGDAAGYYLEESKFTEIGKGRNSLTSKLLNTTFTF